MEAGRGDDVPVYVGSVFRFGKVDDEWDFA